MKNAIITVIVGLTIFALMGCAPVKFYSNLKNIPQAGVASTIMELYEIFMGPEGTIVKKVEFK